MFDEGFVPKIERTPTPQRKLAFQSKQPLDKGLCVNGHRAAEKMPQAVSYSKSASGCHLYPIEPPSQKQGHPFQLTV